jgi:hypothetical protein
MLDDSTNLVASAPAFSEHEMQMLAWAMQSLESGAPEVSHSFCLRSLDCN